MNLTDFTAMVKDEANKGDRLDAIIPARVALAVQRLERRYTLKYMERFVILSLDPDATEPRAVQFPANGMKGTNFMRYSCVRTGRYRYLHHVDAGDVTGDAACNPTGYWFDGVKYIWFDNSVQEALDLEFSFNEKSTWPPANDEHWLLANAADCLLAETMMLLATRARAPEWKQLYGDMLNTAQSDLFREDNELRNADMDTVMVPPGADRYSNRNRYPGDTV